jgi:hypothetical protein
MMLAGQTRVPGCVRGASITYVIAYVFIMCQSERHCWVVPVLPGLPLCIWSATLSHFKHCSSINSCMHLQATHHKVSVIFAPSVCLSRLRQDQLCNRVLDVFLHVTDDATFVHTPLLPYQVHTL